MPLLLLLSLLSATPAEGPVTLAMPGLRCVNIDAQTCEFFGDYFAQQLSSRAHVRVTTQAEIATLLGFERQKQLLGCADASTSCIAELAGGLGVEGLIVGNLAQIADEYVLNVKVLAAVDGTPMGAESLRIAGEKALLDGLASAATKLGAKLPRQPKTSQLTPPPPPAVTPRPLAGAAKPFLGGPQVWGPGLGGLLAGGVGTAFLAQAWGTRAELHQAPAGRTTTDLDALIARGQFQQNLGAGLLIGGGVLLGVAGGLFVWGAAQPPTVSVSFAPRSGGFQVAVGGELP